MSKIFKSEFEKWIESASIEELEDAYENERQKWIKNGYCNGTGEKTPEMKMLNAAINKRRADEQRKNNPKRNNDPNFRWTDANRWE